MNAPAQNEWDFSKERIEHCELPWCFRYEYGRTSDRFLESTDKWRKKHKKATEHFGAALESLKRFGKSGLLDAFPRRADPFCALFPLLYASPEDQSSECVALKLVRLLTGHEFRTALEKGWVSFTNGRLLSLAEAAFSYDL